MSSVRSTPKGKVHVCELPLFQEYYNSLENSIYKLRQLSNTNWFHYIYLNNEKSAEQQNFSNTEVTFIILIKQLFHSQTLAIHPVELSSMKTRSFIVNRNYCFFFASPHTLLQRSEHSFSNITKLHQFIPIQTSSYKAEQWTVLKQREVSEVICQNQVSEYSLFDRPTGIQGACSTWAATPLSRRAP